MIPTRILDRIIGHTPAAMESAMHWRALQLPITGPAPLAAFGALREWAGAVQKPAIWYICQSEPGPKMQIPAAQTGPSREGRP